MIQTKKPLYSIPVTHLLDEIKPRRFYVNRKEAMHYCSPSAGGWGVVRVACLVPQVEVLFVIPMGCGRHGAIASFANQTSDKLSYLLVEEVDIVTGAHLEKLENAIDDLIEERAPKGLIICSTCMDDLLGSDYKSLENHLEMTYGIPIKHGKMNPIMAETRKAPELMIQQTIYDFINPDTYRDDGVNIIGSFVPISPISELETVLEEADMGPLRHIGKFETYADYQTLSQSNVNLLVHPLGIVAAKHLEKHKNQHMISAFQGFTLEEIDASYVKLENYCKRVLNIDVYRNQYIEAFKQAKILDKKIVAVGTTINARPFELTKFLCQLGFQVRYIVAKKVGDSDMEHVEWLKKHAPNLEILPNLEPSVGMYHEKLDTVDYCFGLDAALLFNFSYLIDLPFDEFLYGYLGAVELMERIQSASLFTGDVIETIYQANLVI